MKLIVGNMSNAIKDFIKRNNFTEHVLVINKMCNVKTIKEPVDVIIPFGYLTDVGLISNTLVHLEELIMSVDVKSIKYGNMVNREKIDLIGKKYGIPVEHIDNLNKRTRLLLYKLSTCQMKIINV